MTQNKTKIIGLTGNSGSGKTTISNILREIKIPVIDADEISHDALLKGKKCYYDVIGFFGTEILDEHENINRRKLGEIVFKNRDKLEKLNELTHGYIIDVILKQIDDILLEGYSYKYIVIDIPILINTKLQDKVDEIWVVYADYETLTKRLLIRNNISREEIENRLDKQLDLEVLKKYADFLIENNGDENKLKKKILSYINIE